MEAYFEKRDLKKFLKRNSPIGEGYFGSLYKYNDDYLIKAFIDENHRETYKDVFKYIEEAKIQDEYYDRFCGDQYYSREDSIRKAMVRLSYTKYSYDLIQGLAHYYSYCFGSVLKYYKDYTSLDELDLDTLTDNERVELFHNIDIAVEDLLKNNIYPLDIKEDNVLYDDNLNIKLIDLDDNVTMYCDSYNEVYERECLNYVHIMKKELTRCKK